MTDGAQPPLAAPLVAHYFDQYGEQEWARLIRRPSDEVSFAVHAHYLQQFISAGEHVLEVGAGPGRFTIALAQLGARVTVCDVSAIQLELNARYVREAGAESAVVERRQQDACNLSPLPDARFDAVVCYGGVLSYAGERTSQLANELMRVVRPGGHVLVSVMPRLHNQRKVRVLESLPHLAREYGLETARAVALGHAFPTACTAGPARQLFSAASLRSLFAPWNPTVLVETAVNCLSAGNDHGLVGLREDSSLWAEFLSWELLAGQQPGALECGHHLLSVIQRARIPVGAA